VWPLFPRGAKCVGLFVQKYRVLLMKKSMYIFQYHAGTLTDVPVSAPTFGDAASFATFGDVF